MSESNNRALAGAVPAPACELKAKGQIHTCRELWPFKERGWCAICEEGAVPASSPAETDK
jgi:hypothetical protein